MLARKYVTLIRNFCAGDRFSIFSLMFSIILRKGLAASKKSGNSATDVWQLVHSVASSRNGCLQAGHSVVNTRFFPPHSLYHRFTMWWVTKSIGPASLLHFGHFECFIENTSLHRLFKHLIFTIGVSSAFFGADVRSLGRFSLTACPSIDYCRGIFYF